jgi:hypothetical protein
MVWEWFHQMNYRSGQSLMRHGLKGHILHLSVRSLFQRVAVSVT